VRFQFAFGAVVALSVFSVPFRASAAPSSSSSGRAAAEHFEAALNHVDHGDYEQAVTDFERAYEAQPHPSVLYNLALAYVALRRPVQAIDTFERFLAEAGSSISPQQRRAVEEELERQNALVGQLVLEVTPDDARVSVDEVDHGTRRTLRLLPGSHRLKLDVPGHRSHERVLEVIAGSTDRLDISLPLIERDAIKSLRVHCPISGVVVKADEGTLATTDGGRILELAVPQSATALVLSRRGYESQRIALVEVDDGSDVHCKLSRRKPSVATRTALPAQPRDDVADGGSDPGDYGLILLGSGAALLAGGAGIYLWSETRVGEWETHSDQLERLPAGPERDEHYTSAQELSRSIQAWDIAANVLGGVGIAAIGTGVVMLLTGEESGLRDGLTVESVGNRLQLRGHF